MFKLHLQYFIIFKQDWKGKEGFTKSCQDPRCLPNLTSKVGKPYLKGLGLKNQKAIKDGDQKSFSIAAASILAKVHRDKIMRSLARKPRYKVYGWGRNKGYGTRFHQQAIKKYGLTRYHRKQFVRSWRKKGVNE